MKPTGWGVVWFAAFLCLMTLVGSIGPGASKNPFLGAFFSFLPIVFLLIVHAQREADKTIRNLETRIEALEAGRPDLEGSHLPVRAASGSRGDVRRAGAFVLAMVLAVILAILGAVLWYALVHPR